MNKKIDNNKEEEKEKHEEPQTARKIGFLSFVLINVGLSIGYGTMIFAPMAAYLLGPASIFALLIVLVISLTFVLSMAEMATIFPYAGGITYSIQYGYARKIGNLFLMIALVLMIFTLPTSQGGEALSFAYYIKHLIPALKVLPDPAIAILLVLTICVINCIGVRAFAGSQVLFVLLFLIPMVLWGLLAIPHINMAYYTSQPFLKPDVTPIVFVAALGILYWAFTGTEYAGSLAGEVKYPLTVIPRGMVLSALLVFLVNAWVIIIGMGLAPLDILGKPTGAPLAAASEHAGLGVAVVGLIAFSALAMHSSSINTALSENGRAFYSAGRSGLLPKWFGKLHPRFRTPVNALVFLTIVLMIIVLPNLIMILGTGACMMSTAINVILLLSVLSLKKRKPSIERPFKVPTWLPVVGIGFAILLAVGLTYYLGLAVMDAMGCDLVTGEIISIVIGLIPIILGVLIYIGGRKKMEEPMSFDEFKEQMKVDESARPEKEWSELKAPLRATGEELRKINIEFYTLLIIFLSLVVFTAIFGVWVYLS